MPDPLPALEVAPTEPMPYAAIADLVRRHARQRPNQPALIGAAESLSYAALDTLMDRLAATLQRDGLRPGDVVAVCARASPLYGAIFLGALRAGVVVAPLAPSASPESFASMCADAEVRLLFVDGAALAALGDRPVDDRWIALDDQVGGTAFGAWLAPAGTRPGPVDTPPEAPFNIIYSSGTTGMPKGIVQSHGMRWSHVARAANFSYGPDGVTLLATPLYSNTTLVVFFPTMAAGGTVVMMDKFDAGAYLALAQTHRMTHTMLVPVQYQRLMARADFDAHDLSSTRVKFCTSAPFAAALKADVLARWPGGLVEFYGMTEGGGTCILQAHAHPTKLHTVGQPAAGHDIRLIDENGLELPGGAPYAIHQVIGEVVGRSAGMMTGYHRQPGKTREAEWFDVAGNRFIRSGDIGHFDADGFLILLDRKKDIVISGGFNIYPSDLEAVLRQHPRVDDAAVVGVPSTQWGETPIAFVVWRSTEAATGTVPGSEDETAGLLAWVNQRVGKVQRLAAVFGIDRLPRSAIGKVLKRELRDRHAESGMAPR